MSYQPHQPQHSQQYPPQYSPPPPARPRKRGWILGLLGAFAVLVLVAAVTSTSKSGPGTVTDSTTGSTTGSAVVDNGGRGTGSGAPGTAGNPLAFGKTVTGDTYAVTVGKPAQFTPSSNAVALGGGTDAIQRAVKMVLTVANHSGKALSPYEVQIEVTDAQGHQVPEITDLDKLGLRTADVPASGTGAWDVGYSVPPARGRLTVSVQVGYLNSSDPVYYAGTV